MSERGKDFFNELAGRWDDLRAADGEKIAGLVGLAGLRAGDEILDVGCGTGVLLPWLLAAAGSTGRVTAVDFAENMVARAREKVGQRENITYVVGDIWFFEPAGAYDAIFCFNFFPHVGDKPGFLAKMAGFLKERGSIVIMHDMSRAAVNVIHAGSRVVTDDRLPAGVVVADMLAAAGYEVRQVIDDNERYFIKAGKTMSRD